MAAKADAVPSASSPVISPFASTSSSTVSTAATVLPAVSPTTINVTLPPGPLGFTFLPAQSGDAVVCKVATKTNVKSPLEIDDTILSLDGITLSQVEGGMETWKTLFSTLSYRDRSLVVTRLPRANAAATAGSYKQQPSFGSIQEEKKEEYDSNVPEAVVSTAPGASKAPPPASPTRRSSRKRTSTTMVIGGHVVKTSNNYVVTGMNYIHGAFTADEPKPKKPKPVPSSSKAPVKKPRAKSAHETDRLNHNEIIKKRIVKDESARLEFMTRNSEALEPFIDHKVEMLLNANSQVVKKGNTFTVTPLGTQPDIVTTPLRDYQLIGLSWMVSMQQTGMPFILGDEMGLGKTLQTISLIAHLKESRGYTGPSLVICPLSVLYSWCNEITKHAPTLKYFRFHSSDSDEREHQKHLMAHEILKYDVVVTTYEMIKNPQLLGLIRNTYFNLCVLDEGHVIKSVKTLISEAARKIHCQTRVILTGTPLQNNLVELYAILNYLYPTYFTSPTKFEDAFDITHNRIDPDMLLKANKLLKLFMIRRLKEEVEKLMPKKIETKILCPLSSSQIFWYKGFLMKEVDTLVKLQAAEDSHDLEASKGSNLVLRNLVMQLRKVCLHPYLFDFAEGDLSNTSLEELIATSGKLAVLDKLLISLFKNGHRTCIFSQFTTMLDILEDYCSLRGWKYVRFDGGTPRAQRNHIINQFNAPGSHDFIFLMSTKSGGLGINLQTADTCILYDSDWNPQPDLQAMARVHRIGQTKTVHVYRLLSSGTVEERVVERQEKKLYLDQMVNRGASTQGKDEVDVSTTDLLATLKFGSNAIFCSSNDLPTDSDIDKLTDRNRSEESSGGLLKGGVTQTVKDFEHSKELTDTMAFSGVDFRKLREEKERSGKSGPKSKFLENLKQDWKEAQDGGDGEMGKGQRVKKSRLIMSEGIGSGYGSALVPVLALNNYSLESGEQSCWRETKKGYAPVAEQKKKTVNEFAHQDFCQFCGDGGTLIECPRCPVSCHASCCGIKVGNFQCCSHHRCYECHKTAIGGGGLLYRCQSCPLALCPDCLPDSKEIRFLGSNIPRF
eukprot:CCRYP_014371-RB/>CCRYP_014371-RB protein AED:0.04 eAED:0.04 QI:131/1/1/1/1/1/6/716/1063